MYPALAVLQALQTKVNGSWFEGMSDQMDKPSTHESQTDDLLWVGSEGGMEAELVRNAGIPFAGIPAAGLHGVGWRAAPGNLRQILRGVSAARRILREFRPDVIFTTGGYVSGPVALAARLPSRGSRRPRSLLCVPDLEPGLALKGYAYFADCITLTVEESRRFFSTGKRTLVTGYPTRPDLSGWERPSGRQLLGLAPDLPVLLVTGGSKGARSINRAVVSRLAELLPLMQIVHVSGNLDWAEVEAAHSTLPAQVGADLAARYRVYPYLHKEMGAALAAADLVVCRAGASTLGELPLFSLPAVLVPYPHAWRYQQENARYLADRGAAVIVQDAELAAWLVPVIRDLLDNPGKMQAMRSAMHKMARPDAAGQIARELRALAVRSAR